MLCFIPTYTPYISHGCRKGNLELLQLLLKRDTLDLTIRAHHGMPPLHIAAWHGHAHIVSTLINNGLYPAVSKSLDLLPYSLPREY